MRGLYLVSVWLHVLAAMAWVGGMIVFVSVLLPFYRAQAESVKSAFLADYGRRFRTLTWICLAILVLTGTVNLWARGVRAADFVRPEWLKSTFGHLVVLKLSLIAAAVTISALHECATTRFRARWLGRLTLLAALAIVWVAVLLVRSA